MVISISQARHRESPEGQAEEKARKDAEAKAAKVEAEDLEATIKNHKVRIGMTAEQCRRAWGRPESINRTTTSAGTHEQWVYGRNYLYLDNGVLTAVQN